MLEKELELAKQLAKEAGDKQLEYLNKDIRIEIKGDNSPVTEIDQACEKLIREAIEKNFPEDGILGEETGKTEGSSGRTWIIDPIDGTRPYIRKIPTFSVLIGLEINGRVDLGVINLPGMNELLWAVRGEGAFCNGYSISVSSIDSLDKATCSALGYYEHQGHDKARSLYSLMEKFGYEYGFMDAYTYACIAQGKIDLCVNLLDKPWDKAPAICIIEEAGGKFTDVNGNSDVYGDGTVLSNGKLHNVALSSLSS